MRPLWKIKSGEFAGWRSKDDHLFSAEGEHIGFIARGVAYSLRGSYLGEIEGDKWLGVKPGKSLTRKAPRKQRAPISKTPLPNRDGRARSGWEDPDI